MNREPVITINGKQLKTGEAMTFRVAMNSFLVDLQNTGLGSDPTGRSITEGYRRACMSIHRKMELNNEN